MINGADFTEMLSQCHVQRAGGGRVRIPVAFCCVGPAGRNSTFATASLRDSDSPPADRTKHSRRPRDLIGLLTSAATVPPGHLTSNTAHHSLVIASLAIRKPATPSVQPRADSALRLIQLSTLIKAGSMRVANRVRSSISISAGMIMTMQ